MASWDGLVIVGTLNLPAENELPAYVSPVFGRVTKPQILLIPYGSPDGPEPPDFDEQAADEVEEGFVRLPDRPVQVGHRLLRLGSNDYEYLHRDQWPERLRQLKEQKLSEANRRWEPGSADVAQLVAYAARADASDLFPVAVLLALANLNGATATHHRKEPDQEKAKGEGFLRAKVREYKPRFSALAELVTEDPTIAQLYMKQSYKKEIKPRPLASAWSSYA